MKTMYCLPKVDNHIPQSGMNKVKEAVKATVLKNAAETGEEPLFAWEVFPDADNEVPEVTDLEDDLHVIYNVKGTTNSAAADNIKIALDDDGLTNDDGELIEVEEINLFAVDNDANEAAAVELMLRIGNIANEFTVRIGQYGEIILNIDVDSAENGEGTDVVLDDAFKARLLAGEPDAIPPVFSDRQIKAMKAGKVIKA